MTMNRGACEPRCGEGARLADEDSLGMDLGTTAWRSFSAEADPVLEPTRAIIAESFERATR